MKISFIANVILISVSMLGNSIQINFILHKSNLYLRLNWINQLLMSAFLRKTFNENNYKIY